MIGVEYTIMLWYAVIESIIYVECGGMAWSDGGAYMTN